MRFPEGDGGYHRRPRDELEFPGRGEERFFHEREFGRPPGFGDDRRYPGDRRMPLESEHEDPLHPAYRFLLQSY